MTGLELEILRALRSRSGMAAAEIREALVPRPSSSQVYILLELLERRGLVAAHPSAPGRAGLTRRLWSLTDAGQQALGRRCGFGEDKDD